MESSALVSCSNVILTHSSENPEPSNKFQPHSGKINSVTWNHNNRVLGSCGDDGWVYLSHSESGTVLGSLPPDDASVPLNSLAFTNNSEYLACAGQNGAVTVWDLRKKSQSVVFRSHPEPALCVEWNSTDSNVASGSKSGEINLNSIVSASSVAKFKHKNSMGIKDLKYSPFKKQLLAAASENGSVYIYDVNSRQLHTHFPNYHNSPVSAIAYSPVNHLLLCSAGLDQRIQFYDITDKRVVKTIEANGPLTSISFFSDGHTIATGTMHGAVHLYDLRAAAMAKATLKGHSYSAVNDVEFKKGQSGRGATPAPEASSAASESAPSTTKSRFRTIDEIRADARNKIEQKKKERAQREKSPERPAREATPDRMEVDRISERREENKVDRISDRREENKITIRTADRLKPEEPSIQLPVRKATSANFEKKPETKPPEIPPKQVPITTAPITTFRVDSPVNESAPQDEEKVPQTPSPPTKPSNPLNNLDSAELTRCTEHLIQESELKIKEQVTNLHLELLRQFSIQQTEITQLILKYSTENENLRELITGLEDENAKLRQGN